MKQKNNLPKKQEMKDVIILGAGLSGLSAARCLIKSNPALQITILEARSRVGGRMLSKKTDGGHFDLGACWIGIGQTRMIKLCKEVGVHLEKQFFLKSRRKESLNECIGYMESGLNAYSAKKVTEFLSFVKKCGENMNLEKPWQHPKAEEWDKISYEKMMHSHVTDEKARLELRQFVEVVLACRPSDVSFLFFVFVTKSGGDMRGLADGEESAQNWYVKEGSAEIPARMAEALKTQGVEIREKFVAKHIKHNSNSVLVKGRDGQLIEGKHLIVACSPRLMLKRTSFSPRLELGKRKLYSAMQSGNAYKAYFIYKDAFWKRPQLAKGDLPHVVKLGPIHNIYNMDVVLRRKKRPGLVCLSGGAPSDRLIKVSKRHRRTMILRQFVKMYSDRATPKEIRSPLCMVDKSWRKERYSGGCYAINFPPNGTFSKYGKYMSSITGNRIHWASTDTSSRFHGYMEGAVRAGERAAREII